MRNSIHYLAYHQQNDQIAELGPTALSEVNVDGDTVAHIAAKMENRQLIAYVLQTNPNTIYLSNNLGFSPFYYLLADHDLIRDLIQTYQLADHLIGPGLGLLQYYVVEKQADLVCFLLEYMTLGKCSRNVIHAVVNSEMDQTDKQKIINQLLALNISINELDEYYMTPIIYAAYLNDTDIIIFLLSNGANVNYCGPEDTDHLLTIALYHRNYRVAGLLLDYNIDVNIRNKYLQTPLHYLYEERTDTPQTLKKQIVSRGNVYLPDNQMHTVLALMKRAGDDIEYQKPKSIPTVRMIMIDTRSTYPNTYSAYTHHYICYLLYLCQKYPELDIPHSGDSSLEDRHQLYVKLKSLYRSRPVFCSIIKDYLNHGTRLINHIIIWESADTWFVSPWMINGLAHVVTPYVLIKLTIVGQATYGTTHANMLIYDVKNKTIERFDPYGYVPFIDSDTIDSTLGRFFAKHLPDVRYICLKDLSDRISLQIFSNEIESHMLHDPNGFCTAWCLWYVEMRLLNKHIVTAKLLINKAIYWINDHYVRFKDYIRNYANYLDWQKNQIYRRANISSNYWYATDMPLSVYESYIKYIRLQYNE